MLHSETPKQARNNVKNDLRNNVRIVSPNDFCKSLLPLNEDFDRELNNVKKRFYNNRWKGFPDPLKEKDLAESKFYGPYVNIAQAVSEACRKRAPQDAVKSDWIDCSKAPATLSKDDAEIRPGIVQVSASTSLDFHIVNESLCEAKGDEKQKLSSIWWTQIHTIVEVKPRGPRGVGELHDTIVQLCSYIRQVFREQFDRRFVIALLLCGDGLTLWYCDRVGLVGTIDPINIHDKPDEFLKILAAFSMLPAHKLGWDPTMKLYPKNGTEAVPSYTVFQRCHPSMFRWSIPMPSEEDPHLLEEFITIRALLTVVSQRICGRASIVWEVIKKRDYERGQDDPPIYVLKQAWQPVDKEVEANDGVFEARMYAMAGMYEDRIYSHERVKKGNDIFSTESFRGNCKDRTYRQAVEELKLKFDLGVQEGKRGRKRTHSNAELRSEHEAPYSYIQLLQVNDNIFRIDDQIQGNDNNFHLHPRTLVRILMKKHGYSLRHFVDNFELVTVLRDVVQDHKNMYDKGILHRDISSGNILICDDDDDETKDAGMLIDLDHSKYSAKTRVVPKHPIMDEEMEYLQSTIFRFQKGQEVKTGFNADVLSKAWGMFGIELGTVMYLVDFSTARLNGFGIGNDITTVWTANDLYWPDELEQELPDFSTHEARKGPELTGTIPFISAELVESSCINVNVPKPVHNAVHDMESLLWVLVSICLTQDGKNGVICRQELQLAPGVENDLTRLVRVLFGQRDAKEKLRCLTTPAFFENILEHVHPYFNCLKPLLLRLRWALYFAHLYKGVEHYNIHKVILSILDETVVELRQERNNTKSDVLEAKRKRRDDWGKRRLVSGQFSDTNGEKGESDHLPNPGGYSPVSKAQSDSPFPAIPSVSPDSPSPAPKRKRSKRFA
ncbi:hypothetical protein F5887DRAFT_235756 [Amanita rubescens]|nr:hypothetical protein F5887DRAFT_235756 [Amanita rubescens]